MAGDNQQTDPGDERNAGRDGGALRFSFDLPPLKRRARRASATPDSPAPPPAAEPPDRPVDPVHRTTARLMAREDEIRAALTGLRAEQRALDSELRREGSTPERSARLRDLRVRESRLHADLGRLRRQLAAARAHPAE
ncbi:MAG TPA: hypothetical protein VFN74_20930 [Chloroflexota bacterium]|nr:hypothetical protein [Chloroflexota bacterium]